MFEDVAVKTALWRDLDARAPAAAIFASNTSSISIDRLAAAVAPDRRARFAGMHFFSPVPVMPLVELIRGSATDAATEAAIRGLAGELGKAVIVSADRPGFLVNRILMPLPGRGDARATRKGSARPRTSTPGRRSGSTTRWARSSWPTSSGSTSASGSCASSTTGSAASSSARREVLEELVAAGHLGQKTGRGFFTYPR